RSSTGRAFSWLPPRPRARAAGRAIHNAAAGARRRPSRRTSARCLARCWTASISRSLWPERPWTYSAEKLSASPRPPSVLASSLQDSSRSIARARSMQGCGRLSSGGGHLWTRPPFQHCAGGPASVVWVPGASTEPGVLHALSRISTRGDRSASTTSWRRWGTALSNELPELRVRGRWPPPCCPKVAIVGARRPTPYGEAVAERLATDLAHAGVAVVSGLAVGVDAAAHEGALIGEGCTIAVLGTGVDVIYPAANTDLAARIVARGGALVSQFPDGTGPKRDHFPRRNWTMAALADLVVVVEAAEGSGALITAEAGLAQGKAVMAVPGSVFSPLSVGCHQLLRDGAGLVQNARDVLGELNGLTAVLDDPL